MWKEAVPWRKEQGKAYKDRVWDTQEGGKLILPFCMCLETHAVSLSGTDKLHI